MAHEKLTALLTETICVTREEAEAALEAEDWNLLEAAQLLQQRQRAARKRESRKQPPRGMFARLFGAE